jgi:hypothetical protein
VACQAQRSAVLLVACTGFRVAFVILGDERSPAGIGATKSEVFAWLGGRFEP